MAPDANKTAARSTASDIGAFADGLAPEEICVLQGLSKKAAEYVRFFVRAGNSDSETVLAYADAIEAAREFGGAARSAIEALERATAHSRQAHWHKSAPDW